jgi:AraC family transcriptional regulator
MAGSIQRPDEGLLKSNRVEAVLRMPLSTTQIVRFTKSEPGDDTFLVKEAHNLDLSLTPRPRNARGCYPERWSPHRFERLGDLVFSPAGEVVRVKGDCASLVSINCQLHAAPLREAFEDDLEFTDRELDASLDIRSDTIRRLVLRLGSEARCPGFASEMLSELVAAQIAVELFRYRGAVADRSATGGLAPWRLRIIDERLAEQRAAPSLAELARLCDLSVRQLARGFRTSRGCSLGKYVAQSQIDHAKRLLTTDESIKSIAYSLGFASPSNFSYAFRRATGQTPRQFRRSQSAI